MGKKLGKFAAELLSTLGYQIYTIASPENITKSLLRDLPDYDTRNKIGEHRLKWRALFKLN